MSLIFDSQEWYHMVLDVLDRGNEETDVEEEGGGNK